jgi:hypothetical protein
MSAASMKMRENVVQVGVEIDRKHVGWQQMVGRWRRTIIGSGKTKCGKSNGMLGLEMAYILGEIIGWSRNEKGW